MVFDVRRTAYSCGGSPGFEPEFPLIPVTGNLSCLFTLQQLSPQVNLVSLLGENRLRAGAEGAVIEILDRGVEAPLAGEIRYDFRQGNALRERGSSLRQNSPTNLEEPDELRALLLAHDSRPR